MTVRPRLLFISPRFLFPLDQGGRIRTANTLRFMRGGAFDITLASPVPAGWEQYRAAIDGVCDRFVHWPVPTLSNLRRALLLLDEVPIAAASDRSVPGRALVATQLAEKPDVVLVDFPHAAVLLPDGKLPPSVMFTHNVEVEIFDRHAAVSRGLWRLIWRNQARKMNKFEGGTLRRFDSVIAVSTRDSAALKQRFGLPRVETIDTGVDVDYYPFTLPDTLPSPRATGGTIIFSGAMDSRANIDGVEFLMDEIWPHIAAVRPEASALIVGRSPPEGLVARAKAKSLPWEFTGFVDDIRDYVSRGHVSVIPLRVGSGTRMKAFEAMAMGRPVVSTTLGVEGLSVTREEHFLQADTAADFAKSVLRLLDDRTFSNSVAIAARQLVVEKFSWAHVARQFENICLGAYRHSR